MFFLAACSCFKHFINRYKYIINIYIDMDTCMCVCGCLCVSLCVCLCVGVCVCDRVGVLCVCWRERSVFVVPSAVSSRQLKLNSFMRESE